VWTLLVRELGDLMAGQGGNTWTALSTLLLAFIEVRGRYARSMSIG
jgi:hypothetical protein